jgi:LytR cell envelope-related transcriptional attenuator
MGSLPLAFSVHHFIDSVGAYCGFAAIIGLAILILLYFAQARETATLREHAYEAAQRIQQLEARIAQLVRSVPDQAPQAQPAAAQRAPAPVQQRRSVAVSAGVAAASATFGAPAGVGAPPLAAATKLIPTDVPGTAEPEPEEQPDDYTRIGAPAPATAAAAGTNGATHERIPPPAAAAPPPPPRVQIRPGAPAQAARRPASPPPRSQGSGRGIPRGVIFLLGGLLIVAVVAVLLIVTSGGGNSPASNAGPTTNSPSAARRAKRVAAFSPSTVNVSVLNGTSTSGLANRIATQLSGDGYKEGKVTNAADQTQTSTVVAYLPGHKEDAVHVATALKLGASTVQPIDSNTQAVACPPPGNCTSTVVVTVGSDLAGTT